MNNTLSNVETGVCRTGCPCSKADMIPLAVDMRTGVSVRYMPSPDMKWYVFRATYGREERAYDYIVGSGTYAYIAKRYVWKESGGRKMRVTETLIPNLLFVYTTEDRARGFIKSTSPISFLSYYYNHFRIDTAGKNPPLTISCKEMENFIIATSNRSEHLRFVEMKQCHFKSNAMVRVIEGIFKGVEGRVARVAGQQRVVITLSQVGLVSTAYIPTAFIEELPPQESE